MVTHLGSDDFGDRYSFALSARDTTDELVANLSRISVYVWDCRVFDHSLEYYFHVRSLDRQGFAFRPRVLWCRGLPFSSSDLPEPYTRLQTPEPRTLSKWGNECRLEMC